jgi:predicted nucleic-acid-binding protein
MINCYFDTNYLLRLILNDNSEQYNTVKALIENSDKYEDHIYVSSVAVCEVEWVLRSFYKFKKQDIIDILQKILLIH